MVFAGLVYLPLIKLEIGLLVVWLFFPPKGGWSVARLVYFQSLWLEIGKSWYLGCIMFVESVSKPDSSSGLLKCSG